MIQNWLNFAGLALDFAGVLLLAYEWRIAVRAEQQEAAIAAREQMFKPHPHMPKPNIPQQDVFDWMREKQRFQQLQSRTQSTLMLRRNWFGVALILIAAGFLLQLVGSWPGGLPV
jgi:hypothetical protein